MIYSIISMAFNILGVIVFLSVIRFYKQRYYHAREKCKRYALVLTEHGICPVCFRKIEEAGGLGCCGCPIDEEFFDPDYKCERFRKGSTVPYATGKLAADLLEGKQ